MSLLHHTPRFDAPGAAALAHEVYGLEADASPLPSERDQNFLLETSAGARFVLKIANGAEDRALLEAQNAAMATVADGTGLCPRVVPTTTGESIARQAVGPDAHFVRLVTWIPGRPIAALRRQSPALLEDLGHRLGEVDRALASFDHPALHRDFHWDLAAGFRTVRAHVEEIDDRALRATIANTVDGLQAGIGPLLPALRRSAIHNDANDYNVIVEAAGGRRSGDVRVAGLIDFGDIVHSFTVADLAVALAYAVLDKADPLGAAAAVVRGYCRAYPLTEAEAAALFGLLRLRLCMSVALAAVQQAQRPGDGYLAISQGPIARTLPNLNAIPPRLAEAVFRHACGFEPVPGSSRLAARLATLPPCTPILALAPGQTTVLDLGVGSMLVSGDDADNAESALTPRIERAMRDAGAAIGVGRYFEPRLLYSGLLFGGDQRGERRTIHLGVDLFAPPGTPVVAPLAGVVRLSADNAAPLDYGPVIVLEHDIGGGSVFYTLYGHLTRQSLTTAPVGRTVRAGEAFAEIGGADVNGGWTPHLHVQVIADLLGLDADFPGVCRASERDFWRTLSPDPTAILGLPDSSFPAEALETERALAARQERIGANVRVGYRNPLKVARGWMQYLYDQNGHRYLDAYNNVPHVGHCHPRVVRAAADQLALLNTNTRYLHDAPIRYAERLAATLPGALRVCYFVNSGSEANELALRLARAYTGRRDVIVLESAYHGNSTTLIDISPYKFNGPGGEGAPPWVHVVPVPDLYRGPYRAKDSAAAGKYAGRAADTIAALQAGRPGTRLCAFIAETCPSVAGQICLPGGYLPEVYRHVRAAGGVCIADEVQTAYGRMGTHFYAFEAHGVVPDIVVLGKPIGNGYPLGAVVTTPEIAAAFDNGMEFFSTFGGSTTSCTVGLAVLDVVEDERLQDRALQVGERLLQGLGSLSERHAIVGDVRGSGFFLGVELVTDPDTREPAADDASFVVNRLREEGILIGTDGPFHNVLKIRPPMPFGLSDADRLVETLDDVLSELLL